MGLNWAALWPLTWRSRRHCAARPRSRRSCEAEQGWWRSNREGRPEPRPDSRYRRWPLWWPSPTGGASADGWWPCTCRSEVSGLTILTCMIVYLNILSTFRREALLSRLLERTKGITLTTHSCKFNLCNVSMYQLSNCRSSVANKRGAALVIPRH